jgi:zinc transporter 1/2/3
VTLFYYKIAAALTIFLMTLIAVIYPIRAHTRPHEHHHWLDLGDAFASGVFLGAALFHLLPEAISAFQALTPSLNFPIAEFLCAGGFALLLFLERLSLSTSKHNRHATIPYILAIVIMVHSLIEGAVLGVNTEITALSIIFLAVLAHKGSESFALSAMLSKTKISTRSLIVLIGVFSLMTPLGMIAGTSIIPFLYAREGQLVAAGFNAFAAGTFLYMSTLHHISHHQRLHEAESLLEFFCLLTGLILMGVITIWT